MTDINAPCGCFYPIGQDVECWDSWDGSGETHRRMRPFGSEGNDKADRQIWYRYHLPSCPRGKSGDLKVEGVL